MAKNNVIVVGGGLAGLSCAYRLVQNGVSVTLLESRQVLGGRTSSWTEDGMPVESGLHKFLGIYRALPRLLEDVGVRLSEMLSWVDALNVTHPGGPEAQIIAAPYRRPVSTLLSGLGNNELIPPLDKAKLTAMGAAGIARCLKDPIEFDKISLSDYAASFHVSQATIDRVLSTSTQAILFLPADKFSAYAAFAPLWEGIKSLLTMRLGAFNGGMTEVMIAPIAQAIVAGGGTIDTGIAVDDLIVDDGRVTGVIADGQPHDADHVVLAVPLKSAQQLVQRHFASHPWFQPLLELPSLSAATVQFELDQPAREDGRTYFSSTSMCCFAEQSMTTFRHVPGRLSVILYPPENFLEMDEQSALERVYDDAESLGIELRPHVTRHRFVHHPHDFYAMHPGTESQRPEQQTPVPGLSLAGDYTRQSFLASMEGAVVSGQQAADVVLNSD